MLMGNGDPYNTTNSNDPHQNHYGHSNANRSTLQKSVGWASEDNLIHENNYLQDNDPKNYLEDANYQQLHQHMNSNGFGAMGLHSNEQQQSQYETSGTDYSSMINTTANTSNAVNSSSNDVFISQDQLPHEAYNAEGVLTTYQDQTYYNYAAGKTFL